MIISRQHYFANQNRCSARLQEIVVFQSFLQMFPQFRDIQIPIIVTHSNKIGKRFMKAETP